MDTELKQSFAMIKADVYKTVITLQGFTRKKDGRKEVSVCKWTELKKTHPYEIHCTIMQRAERKYI